MLAADTDHVASHVARESADERKRRIKNSKAASLGMDFFTVAEKIIFAAFQIDNFQQPSVSEYKVRSAFARYVYLVTDRVTTASESLHNGTILLRTVVGR